MKQSQQLQLDYLADLNEQQLDAVLCPADIVFVSAGPGTGKTFLLTSKLVHVIQTSDTAQNIVALSYTNTSARQLGTRMDAKLSECGISKKYTLYSGTIHSFCYSMLKQFYADLQLTILDDEELSELADDLKGSLSGDYTTNQILRCLKANADDSISDLYPQVTGIKDALKVISIQDILVLFINALEEDESFRQWIVTQMTVIAVDEAQDLSALNYDILDLLIDAVPGLKVFLVGDPRQNIFEFNGGSYKNLEEFLSHHPDHAVKTLTITYRCGQRIADYANTFQFTDCVNYQLRSFSTVTGEVHLQRNYCEEDEANYVLKKIQEVGKLNDSAVLCNNLKYLSPLVELLIKEHIPYKVLGGRKLLKRSIRFLNHILRIIDTENAYSIRKVAQYANIDIMQDGKRKKSKFFESELGKTILAIRKDTSNLTFQQIVERVVTDIFIKPETEKESINDYSQFHSMTKKFTSIQDYMAAFVTDKEQFAQFYTADYQECPFSIGDDFLAISTIHSAKGLEWENVFIMGLCEGNFPNPFFCEGMPKEKQEEFFNNEWKKMYVAVTRAKEHLYLTYSRTITRKGFSFRKDPSRFIEHLETGSRDSSISDRSASLLPPRSESFNKSYNPQQL